MNIVKLKEIDLYTDRPPKIKEAHWNKNWLLRIGPLDMTGMRKNGWKIPEELNKLYEAHFTYGYTFERIYTDEDGYLNLTKED